NLLLSFFEFGVHLAFILSLADLLGRGQAVASAFVVSLIWSDCYTLFAVLAVWPRPSLPWMTSLSFGAFESLSVLAFSRMPPRFQSFMGIFFAMCIQVYK
ncbi:hypothetical protein JB92DRAFT_2997233, partial [Gautieria morchelliformis]